MSGYFEHYTQKDQIKPSDYPVNYIPNGAKEFIGFDPASTDSGCLYIKDFGECSWYEENQLTLIEENRLDILKSWKKHRKNAKKDY